MEWRETRGWQPKGHQMGGSGSKRQNVTIINFFFSCNCNYSAKRCRNVCKDLAPTQCSLPSQDDGCQNLFTNCVVVGSDFVAIDHWSGGRRTLFAANISFALFFFFHNLTICTAQVVEGLLATADEIEQNLRGSFITSSLRPVAWSMVSAKHWFSSIATYTFLW